MSNYVKIHVDELRKILEERLSCLEDEMTELMKFKFEDKFFERQSIYGENDKLKKLCKLCIFSIKMNSNFVLVDCDENSGLIDFVVGENK